MNRRNFIIGASFAGTFASSSQGAETASVLPGVAMQGQVLRGKAAPSASIEVNKGPALQADADGNFVLGVAHKAPPLLKVIISAQGARTEHLIAVEQRFYPSSGVGGLPRDGTGQGYAAIDPVFGSYDGPDLHDPDTFDFAATEGTRSSVNLTPEELARVQVEVALKRKAFKSISTSSGWREDFRWPRNGTIFVTSQWGAYREYTNKKNEKLKEESPHLGIDLRAFTGEPIVAPASAQVVLAADRPFVYDGNIVILNHGGGVTTAYLHHSRLACKTGDWVKKGDIIGYSGSTGRANGPHLCWRMKVHGVDVDPTTLIKG